MSRALSGKRQLKADEFEKAKAYFTTPVDESQIAGTQNRPQEEEKEANVRDVIEHIHVMIEEYGADVVRRAFVRALRRPQDKARAGRP